MECHTPEIERAEHEAGHWVMLYILEMKFVPFSMTIEPDPRNGSGGSCWLNMDAKEQDPEHYGIFCLAGAAAQGIGFKMRHGLGDEDRVPEDFELRLESGAGGDIEKLHETLGADADPWVYIAKAREILNDNWERVEALSRELQDHRMLYHDEPRLILECLKADSCIAPFLKVYRDRRQEDLNCELRPAFKAKHPDQRWFESFEDFAQRRRWLGSTEATRAIREAVAGWKRYRKRWATLASM